MQHAMPHSIIPTEIVCLAASRATFHEPPNVALVLQSISQAVVYDTPLTFVRQSLEVASIGVSSAEYKGQIRCAHTIWVHLIDSRAWTV